MGRPVLILDHIKAYKPGKFRETRGVKHRLWEKNEDVKGILIDLYYKTKGFDPPID